MVGSFSIPRHKRWGWGLFCALVTSCALVPLAYADDAGTDEIAAPPTADAPTVGASVDRADALVAEPLTLTVSAVGKPAVVATVKLPDKLALGDVDLLESSHDDRDLGDGKSARRFVLRVAATATGELELPPLTLSYTSADGSTHTVTTAPVVLHVRSLLADEADPKAMPMKAGRSVTVEDEKLEKMLEHIAMIVGGSLVLALGFVIVRRARRRRALRPVPAPPPRPVDELALERLAALRAKGNFLDDRYKPFHFALAEILRGFLGARFGFDALELTTTELLGELLRVGLPTAEPEVHARVVRLLDESDLVKFASAPSSDARAVNLLDEAEAIVRALAPPPPVTVQAAVTQEVAVG